MTVNTNTGRLEVPHISNPESQSFALPSAVFDLQAILRKCTKWSQITLNTKRSRVPDICRGGGGGGGAAGGGGRGGGGGGGAGV